MRLAPCVASGVRRLRPRSCALQGAAATVGPAVVRWSFSNSLSLVQANAASCACQWLYNGNMLALSRVDLRAMNSDIELLSGAPGAERRLRRAERWLKAYEARFSRFVMTSELSRLNA